MVRGPSRLPFLLNFRGPLQYFPGEVVLVWDCVRRWVRYPVPAVYRDLRLSRPFLVSFMLPPPFPHNEQQRIQLLHDLLILDSEPEQRFDAVTSYCQSRFGVAIALVSLVDTDRQWFKSACGLTARQTPREISFCGHAILRDQVMVVSDAKADGRFFDNPLVTGEPFIRFYAAAPLKLTSGVNVGTLCLIDSKPKCLDEEEAAHLKVLAAMVSRELENLGPLDGCTKNCLYGQLPTACPHDQGNVA